MSWTLIESQTLGSSAASVTFSAIPQTFKTLRLVVSARVDADVSGSAITINGLSTNYSFRNLIATGSGTIISQNGSSGANWGVEGTSNRSIYTASTFSNAEITFPNYTWASAKVMSSDGVVENNAAGNAWMGFYAGLNSSASAITSVGVATTSGNFVAGSTFTLYGLK